MDYYAIQSVEMAIEEMVHSAGKTVRVDSLILELIVSNHKHLAEESETSSSMNVTATMAVNKMVSYGTLDVVQTSMLLVAAFVLPTALMA